jgi:hypothetical protein
MASRNQTQGGDHPANLPAHPMPDKKEGAPTGPITNNFRVSKQGVDSARKASGPPATQPSAPGVPMREAPKHPFAAATHKKTDSGDSTTSASSTRVSASDRGDERNREQTPAPQRQYSPTRDPGGAFNGIGSVFAQRTSPPKKKNPVTEYEQKAGRK